MNRVGSFNKIGPAAALFLLLSFVSTHPLRAQQYLGTLTGEVTDTSGAKIANADVSATDVTTHFTTRTKTNGSGGFSIPFLTPDTYQVTVEVSGFRPETRPEKSPAACAVVGTSPENGSFFCACLNWLAEPWIELETRRERLLQVFDENPYLSGHPAARRPHGKDRHGSFKRSE
jgi:hypothetical protein